MIVPRLRFRSRGKGERPPLQVVASGPLSLCVPLWRRCRHFLPPFSLLGIALVEGCPPFFGAIGVRNWIADGGWATF